MSGWYEEPDEQMLAHNPKTFQQNIILKRRTPLQTTKIRWLLVTVLQPQLNF